MGLALASADAMRIDGAFHETLTWVVLAINALTVLVLTWGVLYGAFCFIRAEARRVMGRSYERERANLRRQLGFYLLFGLELLIAADVIETMASPTLEHLAILGGVALIRIVIGYALGRELRDLDQETVNA